MAEASANEVMVSSAVKKLVDGLGLNFKTTVFAGSRACPKVGAYTD
jgi:hypothetical protein